MLYFECVQKMFSLYNCNVDVLIASWRSNQQDKNKEQQHFFKIIVFSVKGNSKNLNPMATKISIPRHFEQKALTSYFLIVQTMQHTVCKFHHNKWKF